MKKAANFQIERIMKNIEILKPLQLKHVKAFHHANSVKTSCTFLEHGALLSRAHVETRGLSQTSQTSDQLDKNFGIWNDVFLDGVDIHSRARTNNHYGPVLFVLNFESILQDKTLEGTLSITRDNPVHWSNDQKDSDRYFGSVDEFKASYEFGDFGKMFTFRIGDGKMPLVPHLNRIVLDDPQVTANGASVYESAYKALTVAAERGRIEIKVHKRECPNTCKCLELYKSNWATLNQMF